MSPEAMQAVAAVVMVGAPAARWVWDMSRPRTPRPPYVRFTPGAVQTALRWCPECVRTETATVHPDGSHTCGHCQQTTTPEGGPRA